MPIRNEKVYCVNHPDIELDRNDTFGAVMTLVKREADVSFDLSRGVPVVVHVCPKCGFVELYAAIKTEWWKLGKP